MFIDNLLQPTHLLIILAVALIVLGPKRLPEVGRALGKGLRDFKEAVSGVRPDQEALLSPMMTETHPPVPPQPAAPSPEAMATPASQVVAQPEQAPAPEHAEHPS